MKNLFHNYEKLFFQLGKIFFLVRKQKCPNFPPLANYCTLIKNSSEKYLKKGKIVK